MVGNADCARTKGSCVKRLEWYNAQIAAGCGSSDEVPIDNDLHEPTADKPANLISSLCDDGFHRPALDIDVPCRLVPSSTEGHCHLYFDDTPLTWEQYERLLRVLVDVGIIEAGFVDASVASGQTRLRLPHVKKHTDEPVTDIDPGGDRF